MILIQIHAISRELVLQAYKTGRVCKLPVLSLTQVLRQELHITHVSGLVALNFKVVIRAFKKREGNELDARQTLSN